MKRITIVSLLTWSVFGAFSAVAQTNKLDSTGFAGVGTTTPQHLLEVVSNDNSASQFKLRKNTTDGVFSILNYSANNVQLAFDAVWYNYLWVAQNQSSAWISKVDDRFSIMRTAGNTVGSNIAQTSALSINLTNGYTGIGLHTPSMKFEVNTSNLEASSVGIHQVNPDGGGNLPNEPTSQIIYTWYGLPKATINFHRGGAAIDGFMSFSTANNNVPVERMRIDQNGNVSIGVTNSYGYKLAVAGNMIAEKIKVKTVANWPDYVFAPSYHLPSLAELEAFIQENRHLPDVPSAAEVEKNGVDVGTTQATFLQKIEELTLYMIAQDKRLNAQQDLISQQQRMIVELGERVKQLEAKK